MLRQWERRMYRLDLIIVAAASCCSARYRCWTGRSCCGKNGGLSDRGACDGGQGFRSSWGTDADVLPCNEIGAITPDRGIPRNELLKSGRSLCRDCVAGVTVLNYICGASRWNAQFLFLRQSRDLAIHRGIYTAPACKLVQSR